MVATSGAPPPSPPPLLRGGSMNVSAMKKSEASVAETFVLGPAPPIFRRLLL